MSEVLLQHEIDRLLDAIDGELTSHSRVVDALLDLRLAGAHDTGFVGEIDLALTAMPGRTAVGNDWWMGQLETLRGAIAPAVTAG